MARKKTLRSYDVDWDESPWEKAHWRPETTFDAVLNLIEDVARAHNRQEYMDQLVYCPLDPRIHYAIDLEHRLSLGPVETSHRRSLALAFEILRTIRELARSEAARIFRLVDVRIETGTMRRQINVRWGRQKQSAASQLRTLKAAVQSASIYRIEKAWFGLTERAHLYLSFGLRFAFERAELAAYKGAVEVQATTIPCLDGYDQREVLAAAGPGKREEFFYWTDDGNLAGLRYDRWKMVFLEQREEGLAVWENPLVPLRFPKGRPAPWASFQRTFDWLDTSSPLLVRNDADYKAFLVRRSTSVCAVCRSSK